MTLVLDKAQELAKAITDSNELNDLRDAVEGLESDEAASGALKDFQEKQSVINRAAQSGIELPPEQMEELRGMQGRIQQIPAVQRFASAQNNFNILMTQVNNIIAAAVTGENPDEACQDDCGPGCGCGH